MNTSETLTRHKVMIPLRLPHEIYEQLMEEVQKRKKKERGYSANQYITELLSANLTEKTHR